jgi:hypothetical protein
VRLARRDAVEGVSHPGPVETPTVTFAVGYDPHESPAGELARPLERCCGLARWARLTALERDVADDVASGASVGRSDLARHAEPSERLIAAAVLGFLAAVRPDGRCPAVGRAGTVRGRLSMPGGDRGLPLFLTPHGR